MKWGGMMRFLGKISLLLALIFVGSPAMAERMTVANGSSMGLARMAINSNFSELYTSLDGLLANTSLADLTDGTLSGSRVGAGIAAENITTGVLSTAVVPFASPAAIGTTTPAAGTFTSVTVVVPTGEVGKIELPETPANGASVTGFKAPTSLAGSVMYVLPATDGTNGQCLKTNGAAVLSWGACL